MNRRVHFDIATGLPKKGGALRSERSTRHPRGRDGTPLPSAVVAPGSFSLLHRRCFPFFLLCFLLMAGAVPAAEFIQQESYQLEATNALSQETYVLANQIDIHGETRDDLFLLGHTLTLTGQHQRDVWAVCDSFHFDGQADDDVRVLARQSAQLRGQFARNLSVAGNAVSLGSNTVVGQDAMLAGENVIVEGQVNGQLYAAGYSITLRGCIGGNARLYANDIVVLPGTEIQGDLVYTSQKELFLNEQVVLRGKLIRRNIQNEAWPTQAPDYRDLLAYQMYFYLAALIAGIPFVSLFPHLTGRAVRQLRRSVWKCALVGFIAFCLIPLLAFSALLTVIGIPLGLLLAAAYAFMLYVSKFFVALAAGGMIFRWNGPQSFSRVFSALSMGLIALYALTLLPVVGSALWLMILFTGLGSLLLGLFQPALPPELRGKNESQFAVPHPGTSSNVETTDQSKENGKE